TPGADSGASGQLPIMLAKKSRRLLMAVAHPGSRGIGRSLLPCDIHCNGGIRRCKREVEPSRIPILHSRGCAARGFMLNCWLQIAGSHNPAEDSHVTQLSFSLPIS